jgi:hypothetical protein
MPSIAYLYVLAKNDRKFYAAPAANSSLAGSLPATNAYQIFNLKRIVDYKASGSNCLITYKNEANAVDQYLVNQSYATVQGLVTTATNKFVEVSVTNIAGVDLATAQTQTISSDEIISAVSSALNATSRGAGAGTLTASTDFLSYGATAPAVGTRIRITAGTLTGNGVVANTDYWVESVDGNNFKISATLGGAAIDLTGTNRTNLTFAVYLSGSTITIQQQEGFIPQKIKVAATLEVLATALNA